MGLYIAAILAGVMWGFGYFSGRAHSAFIARTTYKHEHVWERWEDCHLSNSEWEGGQKVRRLSPGQRRDCLGCGEREVRQLTT